MVCFVQVTCQGTLAMQQFAGQAAPYLQACQALLSEHVARPVSQHWTEQLLAYAVCPS